jgi:hypothetical protein
MKLPEELLEQIRNNEIALKELNLPWIPSSNISPKPLSKDDCCHLIEALRNNTNLQYINLDRQIYVSVIDILEAQKDNKNLRVLKLYQGALSGLGNMLRQMNMIQQES